MLSTLATIGSFALKGSKFINDRINGKFEQYAGGKALELGVHATKRLLNNIRKAAHIIALETAQAVALPSLVNGNAIPCSKILYGSSFQRYIHMHVNKVELLNVSSLYAL